MYYMMHDEVNNSKKYISNNMAFIKLQYNNITAYIPNDNLFITENVTCYINEIIRLRMCTNEKIIKIFNNKTFMNIFIDRFISYLNTATLSIKNVTDLYYSFKYYYTHVFIKSYRKTLKIIHVYYYF